MSKIPLQRFQDFGWQHGTIVGILASGPSNPEIVNVDEVIQWDYLRESCHLLENVGRTHLVLASGKLLL